jgi:hypothetical protein
MRFAGLRAVNMLMLVFWVATHRFVVVFMMFSSAIFYMPSFTVSFDITMKYVLVVATILFYFLQTVCLQSLQIFLIYRWNVRTLH